MGLLVQLQIPQLRVRVCCVPRVSCRVCVCVALRLTVVCAHRPGGIAGVFVHERHAHRKDLHRFGGWWGHTIKTRFDMNQPFDPEVPPLVCRVASRRVVR